MNGRDWDLFDVIQNYGAILLGVVLGVLAKYGLMVGEKRPITFRIIISDLLLVGFVSVLAISSIKRIGVNGIDAVLVAALFALTADRAVKMVRNWWLRGVANQFRMESNNLEGEARQLLQKAESTAALADKVSTEGPILEKLQGGSRLQVLRNTDGKDKS